MSTRDKPPPAGASVWDRPEPPRRASPEPLSRERIVRAALQLADEGGLEAVSLRKVGAALGAGPMRLYGYLATKEELLELLVDAVYGEMAAEGPPRGGWRESLREVAQRTRRAARAHPWFIERVGGRPHQGPNALTLLEAAMAALSALPGFEDIDDVMLALRTVDAYVLGAIRGEATRLREERESGLDLQAWQDATAPHVLRMIATGRFPMLAKVMEHATHPPPDVVFDRGLECVLDGIAARLQR